MGSQQTLEGKTPPPAPFPFFVLEKVSDGSGSLLGPLLIFITIIGGGIALARAL